MKVRATGRAKRGIARAALWWSKNRLEAPLLFLDELEAAERQKAEYHVYFSVNREAQVIMLHSVWGARRGRGPKV